uniref:Ig-like domain-containing protein n=1 Tax=Salmo trutta TaxID=8032 RepID=A0A674CMD3_SALTR
KAMRISTLLQCVSVYLIHCVQGQSCSRVTYTKRTICDLKGSTVDKSCTYVEQGSFWFTQKHPVDLSSYPEYAGRVEYNRNTENHHTMTITDLTEKDSAEYKFRLLTTDEGRFSGLPGVMLTVTDILLEMDPTSVSDGERVTLRCRTKCTVSLNPTYIWYKNGQHPVTSYNSLILDPVSSEDTGYYSCAVEGFERILSPEETLTVRCEYMGFSPSGEIVEDSSVTLTCSSDANPPVDKYTWYKKNVASLTGSEKTYNFTTISSEDSGEYYCEAENKYGRLNSSSVSVDVQYGPKSTSVSVSPSGEIVEGSSVTLTCSSDANPPVDKYTWYFQNKTFLNGFGQMYNISKFKSKDNGHYHCEALNGRGSRNSTALMIILPGELSSSIFQHKITFQSNINNYTLAYQTLFNNYIYVEIRSVNKYCTIVLISSILYYRETNLSSECSCRNHTTVDQDDVHYASVHFSRLKKQEVPLYSTVQLHQPQKQEEDVQYDAVKFNLSSAANQ